MTTNENQKVNYLKDYKAPDFTITNTNLFFEVLPDKLIVKSNLKLSQKNLDAKNLVLKGEDLDTKEIKLNGKILTADQYILDGDLTILNVSNDDILEIQVEINPYTNTKLMGIYKSNTGLCSQCEPEGFRRITWYLDRPDNMSLWNVSVLSEKSQFETILSNGNLVKVEDLGNKILHHFEDPFAKPSYLFAFVAGNFDNVKSVFTTQSGKKVNTAVYVEKGRKNQAQFALDSLHKSMRWDEETFNLEYDLDIFSIVAVADFNFGAMENKSLNIFNEAYILADPYIATDDDYFNIESIVAHEYFHNFTGDRITCQNWFQLTLKEGLTVFRDHLFSEDLHNQSIVRIGEVDRLRAFQFPEDSGPLSHPIRPTSYIEMNNFYTSTVYEKGSEVIRMIYTIIGRDSFKKGIDIYFANFDGQAVTCEDFIWSMEQASNVSLQDFKKWYLYSGTPIVEVATKYDEKAQSLTIDFVQINNKTADQDKKEPLWIPLSYALFDNQGNKIKQDDLFILKSNKDTLVLNNIAHNPTLSINRSFSAPIILKFNQSDEELLNLIKFDDDGFVRYESMQTYLKKHIVALVDNFTKLTPQELDSKITKLIALYGDVLKDYKTNPHMVSYLLKLPSLVNFEDHYTQNFPLETLHNVLSQIEIAISNTFANSFKEILDNVQDNEEEFSAKQMAARSIKARALIYLLKNPTQSNLEVAVKYYQSNSMTKKIATLSALKDLTYSHNVANDIFNKFYQEFKSYPTVLNKWFSLKMLSSDAKVLQTLNELTQLDTFSFNNPNKVRSLFGSFASNALVFHNLDGSGYKILENAIIKMNDINPSISASLAKIFSKINHHSQPRQDLIKKSIENILTTPNLSKGVYEVLSKIIQSK